MSASKGYRKSEKLGEGTSGIVWKAEVLDFGRLKFPKHKSVKRDRDKPYYVAIKKIKLKSAKEGLSQEAIREIKILQELSHPNVVSILDIYKNNANINLVMELMETDLDRVIKDTSFILTPSDVKAYMKMLIEAVAHCHSRWILHRDIKPGNCIVSYDGSLHLTDFGLAKAYGSPERKMSPGACTIWYRAPEMLFQANSYGAAVDIWSVGCVFGELMTRKPMFPSNGTELNQLSKIFQKLGTPEDDEWPERKNLRFYEMYQFDKTEPVPLATLFPAASKEARDLLGKLLRFNPNKRITATQALKHPYFLKKPNPTPLEQMPTVLKRRRQQEEE